MDADFTGSLDMVVNILKANGCQITKLERDGRILNFEICISEVPKTVCVALSVDRVVVY